MQIGSVVLPDKYTPLDCTYPRPQRSIAVARTYTSVAVFDWGALLPGKEISLKWRSMTKALFDSLDVVYQAGAVVNWVSGINAKTYSVKITSFDGTLLFKGDSSVEYMLDITMTMVIIAEVTG